MFRATITGVIPKGSRLSAAPVETREFENVTAAKQWLLGEALTNLPTSVYSVQVFQDGQSVWQAYHSSHDALKSKNELWWDAKDPGRHEREKARVGRKRQVEAGLIPHDQLSLKEQFEKSNPRWLGPFFAWLPTSTMDAGTVWLSEYWVRAQRQGYLPHARCCHPRLRAGQAPMVGDPSQQTESPRHRQRQRQEARHAGRR